MLGKLRGFNPSWFVTYRSWLEYWIEKDAIYWWYCYLFKPHNEEHVETALQLKDLGTGRGMANLKSMLEVQIVPTAKQEKMLRIC